LLRATLRSNTQSSTTFRVRTACGSGRFMVDFLLADLEVRDQPPATAGGSDTVLQYPPE